MRLQAFLARSGAAPSRRKAEALILAGRVEVNGRTALLGESVEPTADRVLLDDRKIEIPARHAYLALNKPEGYLTTLKDERGRPTVANLFPKNVPGLVPVGRLDASTTGLLLLTNDGAFAHRVAHPSTEIEKEYELTIRMPGQANGKQARRPGGSPKGALEERLAALARGPLLDDGPMLPPKLTNLRKKGEKATLNLTIHEGRNRIIRKACAAVGLDLLRLRRVRIGPVRLRGLPEGRHRPLNEKELEALR